MKGMPVWAENLEVQPVEQEKAEQSGSQNDVPSALPPPPPPPPKTRVPTPPRRRDPPGAKKWISTPPPRRRDPTDPRPLEEAAVAAGSTDEPPLAAGSGSIACFYAFVGENANIDEVAADIRNLGATIVFVVCHDASAAEVMEDALELEGASRGDGGGSSAGKGKGKGKQRANRTEFQAQFHVSRHEEIIIAGRVGIVKEVMVREAVATPGDGTIVIADVGLSVAVQQMLSIRVAALCVRKRVGTAAKTLCEALEKEEALEKRWKEVAQTVVSHSVRLIAGEFGETILAVTSALRNYASARVCALEPYIESGSGRYWLGSASMLFIGPVDEVETAEASMADWPWMEVGDTDTHGSGEPRCGGYEIDPPTADVWENLRSRLVDDRPKKKKDPFRDEARAWPIFELIKQKKLTKVIPHTTKTLIYMGSKSSRRSNNSMKYRSKNARKRFQQKPWGNSAAQRNYSR